MPKLNLTELDRLEREATVPEWWNESGVIHASLREGSSVHPASCDSYGGLSDDEEEANAELIAAARSQLRPLLDLVERLGVSLEDAATALHADRAHEGKFWDCGRFGCLTANTLVAEWKQAKGRR